MAKLKKRFTSIPKLTQPKLYGALPRERIFDQLDTLRAHPVIWLSAAPGAGKSTLIASYVEVRGVSTLWFQLDSADNDPATFFHYLAIATQAFLSKRTRKRLPRHLTPEDLGDVPGFSREYFRTFFSACRDNDVLVFDNFQDLASASIAPIMQAIAEVRVGCHIIIISREDPPPLLAPLLANRTVAPLGWKDIKLDLDETSRIARGRLPLGPAQIRALQQQTDGWAAGITLMLDQAQRSGRVSDVGDVASMQTIFDFFAGLVFDQARPREQQALMAISVLPYFTLDMAEELSGDDGIGALIHDLYRRHLFLLLRDAKESSYEFHALFRAFLQSRTQSLLSADQRDNLRHRAGRLLDKAGEPDSAAELYRVSQSWDALSALVLSHAEVMINIGRHDTLRQWIGGLPQDRVLASPEMMFWSAQSQLTTDPRTARTLLETALPYFAERQELTAPAETIASIIEAIWLEYAGFEALDHWFERLEVVLDGAPPFRSMAAELRCYSALVVAAIFRSRPRSKVVRCVEHVVTLLQGALDPSLKLKGALAVMALLQLHLVPSIEERLLRVIGSSAEDPTASPLTRFMWLGRYATSMVWRGDNDEAFRQLSKAEGICEKFPSTRYIVPVVGLWGVWNGLQRADLAFAQKYVAMIGSSHTRHRLVDRAVHAFLSSVVAGYSSEVTESANLALRSLELGRELKVFAWSTYFGINAIRALVEIRDYTAAARIVSELREQLADTFLAPFLAEAALLEAYAALRQASPEFPRILNEALKDAQSFDYYYTFKCVPKHYQILFGYALEHGIQVDYVTQTIRRLNIPAPDPMATHWPRKLRIFALGRFMVEKDGTELEFGRKAPQRLLDFLKAIICLGGQDVPITSLIDAVWGNHDGDLAEQSFRAAVKRLRELLGKPEYLIVGERQVSLNPALVWLDVRAFEHLAATVSAGEATDDQLSELACLYSGQLLPQDVDAAWSVSPRVRVRNLFTQAVEAQTGRLERAKRWQEALAWYRRGIAADDLAERFYQGEMRCHVGMRQPTEARAGLERLRLVLRARLGIAPSRETEELARRLLSGLTVG